MSVLQSENNGWVKWKYAIFILLALMGIAILFFFDTSIWQAARVLVEADYLYVPELFTHW